MAAKSRTQLSEGNESIGSRNENQNNYPYFADEETEALKRQF